MGQAYDILIRYVQGNRLLDRGPQPQCLSPADANTGINRLNQQLAGIGLFGSTSANLGDDWLPSSHCVVFFFDLFT